jgi:hypothetical protein
MNNAQHEIVKHFSLESVLGMGDLIQFLKSIQRLYCTYVLNASTKSMAKAYHDKTM